MNKMERVRELITNWNSSGTNSKYDPQWQEFYKLIKSVLKEELEKVKATNIVFNENHYAFSGFFTLNNQPYYFSLPDVRSNLLDCQLLLRTAQNYKDYHGGPNNWLDLKEELFTDFFDW